METGGGGGGKGPEGESLIPLSTLACIHSMSDDPLNIYFIKQIITRP